MRRLLAILVAAQFAAAGVSAAATPLQRLRGTLSAVTGTSITLQLAGGGSETVAISRQTSYSLVRKSSLAAILPGSYIGTAAKGAGAHMIALEVVVFPPSMRGMGAGHFGWDPLPDFTRPGTISPSSMTNGSVAVAKAASSMTNGNVQTVSTLPGAKQISVVYKGGKQIILLLPATPVVTTAPAGAAVLQPGVHVMIVALEGKNGLNAVHIIAGADGITPPM